MHDTFKIVRIWLNLKVLEIMYSKKLLSDPYFLFLCIGGYVFQYIKNPNNNFMQDTTRNIHTKFDSNQSQSQMRRVFKNCK